MKNSHDTAIFLLRSEGGWCCATNWTGRVHAASQTVAISATAALLSRVLPHWASIFRVQGWGGFRANEVNRGGVCEGCDTNNSETFFFFLRTHNVCYAGPFLLTLSSITSFCDLQVSHFYPGNHPAPNSNIALLTDATKQVLFFRTAWIFYLDTGRSQSQNDHNMMLWGLATLGFRTISIPWYSRSSCFHSSSRSRHLESRSVRTHMPDLQAGENSRAFYFKWTSKKMWEKTLF